MTNDGSRPGAEELFTYILSALENTVDQVLITRLDGKPIFINQSFGMFCGFTTETKKDIDVYALHQKDLVDRVLENAAQNLPHTEEIRLTNPAGEEYSFQLSCSPIEDESFEPQGVCWIYADLTLQKRAEREKLMKEKLQGIIEMGGAACHELNQPLQAVLGQAELLMRSMSSDDPLFERVEAIVASCNDIAAITQKIGNITRYKTMPYSGTEVVDIDLASDNT